MYSLYIGVYNICATLQYAKTIHLYFRNLFVIPPSLTIITEGMFVFPYKCTLYKYNHMGIADIAATLLFRGVFIIIY